MKTDTKKVNPNFIHGDYLTGKDRSYERSLYMFEGFDRETKKVSLRHICLSGHSSSNTNIFDEFTVKQVNDMYRLATDNEVNLYRESKKDFRQDHLQEERDKRRREGKTI